MYSKLLSLNNIINPGEKVVEHFNYSAACLILMCE